MSKPPPLCAESLSDLKDIVITEYCVYDDQQDICCTALCTCLCFPVKIPFLLCCLPSAIYGSCCKKHVNCNKSQKLQDPHELRFA